MNAYQINGLLDAAKYCSCTAGRLPIEPLEMYITVIGCSR